MQVLKLGHSRELDWISFQGAILKDHRLYKKDRTKPLCGHS